MRKVFTIIFMLFILLGFAVAQIDIDGDMLDWATILPADVDSTAEGLGDMVKGANYDIQDLYITGNDSMIYMRIVFDPSGSLTAAYSAGLALSLYLDTDVAAGSGLDWGWWTLSYDYLIDLSEAANDTAPAGELTILNNVQRDLIAPEWPDGWDSVGVCMVAMNDNANEIELGFSKDAIDAWYNLRFTYEVVGEWDWDNVDVAPNAHFGWDPAWMIDFDMVDNIPYNTAVKGPQIESAIEIDGDMLDWKAEFQIDVDETAEDTGDMSTGPDFDVKDVYMTSDSDYVYVRIVIDPTGTFSGQWSKYSNAPVFELHFDTYMGKTQGLSWGNWWLLGGDYKISLQDAYNPDNPQSEIPLLEFTGDYEGAEETYDTVGTVMVALNDNDNEIEIAVSRDSMHVGSDIRPFIYSVGDENWDYEEYFPNDLIAEEGPAYVVNYQFVEGTGAKNIKVLAGPGAIGDEGGAPRPQKFTLYQNYPNPFNPSTNIVFELPKAQKITVTVYDVTGRKVKTLIDDKVMSAGRNEVTWNGLNQKGNAVSSGLYFYRVSTSDYSKIRKMVLMK